MFSPDSPDHLTGFSVSDTGNGTGIDYIYIGLFIFSGRLVPMMNKKGTHGVTVILIYLASKSQEGHLFSDILIIFSMKVL